MKHDFRSEPTGDAADRFCAWLESTTTDALRRSYGNGEAAKGEIFLFANRAYEAHLPEARIWEIFVRCVVHAGYREEDEEPAFAWLEAFGELAAKVHGAE